VTTYVKNEKGERRLRDGKKERGRKGERDGGGEMLKERGGRREWMWGGREKTKRGVGGEGGGWRRGELGG